MKNEDEGPLVELKPGLWLRAGVRVSFRDPLAGELVKCPKCSGDLFTILITKKVKCLECGTEHAVSVTKW